MISTENAHFSQPCFVPISGAFLVKKSVDYVEFTRNFHNKSPGGIFPENFPEFFKRKKCGSALLSKGVGTPAFWPGKNISGHFYFL